MKRSLIALAVVVAVLALAACGGDGYDSSDSPPAGQSRDDIATVSVEELGDYTFVEEPGEATGDGLSDAFDGQQFTWHVVSVGDPPDSSQEGGDTSGSFGY